MELHLLFACNEDNVIGNRGKEKLLWDYKEDLAHFKTLTTNQVILMGRDTYDSMGRLPNRTHLVLTNRPEDLTYYPNVKASSDLKELLNYAKELKANKLFVIGGGGLLNKFMRVADVIHRTLILNHPVDVENPVVLQPIREDIYIKVKEVKSNNLRFQTFKPKAILT